MLRGCVEAAEVQDHGGGVCGWDDAAVSGGGRWGEGEDDVIHIGRKNTI